MGLKPQSKHTVIVCILLGSISLFFQICCLQFIWKLWVLYISVIYVSWWLCLCETIFSVLFPVFLIKIFSIVLLLLFWIYTEQNNGICVCVWCMFWNWSRSFSFSLFLEAYKTSTMKGYNISLGTVLYNSLIISGFFLFENCFIFSIHYKNSAFSIVNIWWL